MSEQMTIDEKLAARARHMDNLNRLRTYSKHWDELTKARGEATMANLMQQVFHLDDSLLVAGVDMRMEA